jgi:hypothetical protein
VRVTREKEFVSRPEATSCHEVAQTTKFRRKHDNSLIHITRFSANTSAVHQKMQIMSRKELIVQKGMICQKVSGTAAMICNSRL